MWVHRPASPQPLMEELRPVVTAPRHARDAVTEACARWGLERLITPAALVVSELVSNVVEHAGTIMTLHVALHESHLYIAVHDGSSAPPVLRTVTGGTAPGGRGMQFVAALSSAWGYTVDDGGKAVWAAVPLSPDPADE